MNEEHKKAIDPKVLVRLTRAIEQLLGAGRDTEQVVEALKPQQSFGKYDGCHPTAIRALAIETCKRINAEIRSENKVVAELAIKSMREHFPDFAKYFRK